MKENVTQPSIITKEQRIKTIFEELGVTDEMKEHLNVSPEAANPLVVRETFDFIFRELEGENSERKEVITIRSIDELDALTNKFVTHRTTRGNPVYNDERQTGRIVNNTFHTTPLRDVEITLEHLFNMNAATTKLGADTQIYKIYLNAGTGDITKRVEMYFTQEGAKLAEAASIMFEPDFEANDSVKSDVRYFALPEYQDLIDSKDPLELINIAQDGAVDIFVGGSTYPGEIYKPICKVLNAEVYMRGGAEVHGALAVVEYPDPAKPGEKAQIAVGISALSLHGKTTLGTADLPEKHKRLLAARLRVNYEDIVVKLVHDDYFYILPTQDGVKMGTYANKGVFPAMGGEESENSITENNRSVFYNTAINKGVLNFKVPFINHQAMSNIPLIKSLWKTSNQRAVTPLNKNTFGLDIQGTLENVKRFMFITLTRDNNMPSVVWWQNLSDAIAYFGAVPVVKTDATMGKKRAKKKVALSFGCSDFTMAPRGPLLERLYKLFKHMEDSNIPVQTLIMNTGKHVDKEESLDILHSVISNSVHWVRDNELPFHRLRYRLENTFTGQSLKPYFPNNHKLMKKNWHRLARIRRHYYKRLNIILPEWFEKIISPDILFPDGD